MFSCFGGDGGGGNFGLLQLLLASAIHCQAHSVFQLSLLHIITSILSSFFFLLLNWLDCTLETNISSIPPPYHFLIDHF